MVHPHNAVVHSVPLTSCVFLPQCHVRWGRHSNTVRSPPKPLFTDQKTRPTAHLTRHMKHTYMCFHTPLTFTENHRPKKTCMHSNLCPLICREPICHSGSDTTSPDLKDSMSMCVHLLFASAQNQIDGASCELHTFDVCCNRLIAPVPCAEL
jgi:hypothetical protein